MTSSTLTTPQQVHPSTPKGRWGSEAQTVERGKKIELRSNLFNAELAVAGSSTAAPDPDFADAFYYDEFHRTAMLAKEILRPGIGSPRKIPRPITDAEVSEVRRMLQDKGLHTIGANDTHTAVSKAADLIRRHPIRDWLNALKWDGSPRLSTWLHDYMGVEDNEYSQFVGRAWLLNMVRRVMEPGSKVDYVPVLEGPQGIMKSSACKVLASEEYFSDSLPPMSSDPVRLSASLEGKWLIEEAEASVMGRAETAALKAFITRESEKYIPKYGRGEVVRPRQCTFVVTCNELKYLRDETGGRRFWPLRVGIVDIERLKADREHLFAEAVAAWRAGERSWPTREFEQRWMIGEQAARQVEDVWRAAVSAYLEDEAKVKSRSGHKVYVTIGGVLRNSEIALEMSRISKADSMRASGILQGLGWIVEVDSSGNKVRSKHGERWVPTDLWQPGDKPAEATRTRIQRMMELPLSRD